jgi:molybdopterin-binding protein
MSLAVQFRHRFTNLHLDVDFEAPTPGVTALFGPSGCGKPSVVMAVAGLLRPDTCRIALNGTVTQLATSHAALVEVELDGATLLARVTFDAVERLGLASGLGIFALVKSMSIEILPG